MLDGKHGKRTWQEIAQEVVEEQDSQKLLKLTKELTEAVDGELAKPVAETSKPDGVDHTPQENEAAFEQSNHENTPKTGTDG